MELKYLTANQPTGAAKHATKTQNANVAFQLVDSLISHLVLGLSARKKICNIVKKSYGLSSLKMLDELEDSSEIYIPLDA